MQAVRAIWYLFRSTFSRRWGGLVALALLIALLGGLAIGAVAGARRTQSSFPAFLKRTNASDFAIMSALYHEGGKAFDAGIAAKIARLPHVEQVGDDTGVDPNVVPLIAIHGHVAAGAKPPVLSGSVDGQWSALDRVTLERGRFADPERADEVVMSASAARELGLHVGSVVPIGFFTNSQLYTLDGCCDASGKGKFAPHLKVNLKLVGIVVSNTQIIEDDIDALGDNPVLLTPALMRELVQCCSYYTFTSIKVDGGARNVPAVLAEILKAFPELGPAGRLGSGPRTSLEAAKAERAIEPESIALGVFGALAALAAFLIAGQLIGRQLRVVDDERAVLRALGAGPVTAVGDGLLGVLGAVVLGALLATVAAVGLSPLAPLGPVRRVEHASVAFDWTVLGFGFTVLVVVLSAIAVAVAYLQAPHRVARRGHEVRVRGSRVARAAASAGFPAPTVTGVRFAFEPGAGPTAVPVRSAMIGAVLAMIVVTSTVTFGSSLRRLVSRPELYGWNWNYELLSQFSGDEDLPQKQVAALLRHDPYVRAWSGVYLTYADVDGQAVAVLASAPKASVGPPILSGHGLDASSEIVLGAHTLAALHKHIGETVNVKTGSGKTTTLRIVGTATMPANENRMTMGDGAVLSSRLFGADQLNQQHNKIPGPNAILIRVHKNASPADALRSLQRINDEVNKITSADGGAAGGVVKVLRPAEIVNYRSTGATPALLGAALAVGAIAALTLTLIASVRRRRRELALLKTLGLTRRQLAAVVAWQSTIAVGIGVVVGIPLGIIIGRSLWDVFARSIHAVPQATVPTFTIMLIAVGALVLANLIASIPARQAARTQTAVLLRSE